MTYNMNASPRPGTGSPLHDPRHQLYNNSNNNSSSNFHQQDRQQYTGLGLSVDPRATSKPQSNPRPSQQPSTKALAITSRATRGSPPPPLMGSAIVLVNDSAMHCFGGRLENRELTSGHYILDVDTGYWSVIQPAVKESAATSSTGSGAVGADDPQSALFSLSLTTDPVNSNSVSLSDALSIPPSPRYFHTLNAYGTSLIVFGGMGTAAAAPGHNEDGDVEGENSKSQLMALDDLYVYDILTGRWQQKFPPVNEHTPRARWAHMATILDHYLVVIGGTDTNKAYVEDACILDLHSWEWVASVQNIGQCGSYRTIAATGPSTQSSGTATPSLPSFPSADAFAPQISSNLSWPATDSGPIDAMASISMILSGRISAPSSTSSSQSTKQLVTDADGEGKDEKASSSKKNSERLTSGELTPAFKAGKDMPSIYLYSNYNFQNLQRELKVISPYYTHRASTSAPMFDLVERSQALDKMGHELPPGLRFPQGHVYQDQLILTGTLIFPGKAPTLAIYALNLTLMKWERLDTDTTLENGSWNRTLLHPASGTLLIFGDRDSNADADYSNRLQHHNHLMIVNLQAYGLYEKPCSSFLSTAQDLGQDLLLEPGMNDMDIASNTGKLFGANSTILAARWPEFATMLLSPPYVTPLILVLPVPDGVVPLFLHYLYTGALPQNQVVSPGVADYLLILARRYQLNGLHALTLDILHQYVTVSPIRIYSSALMAGELGLQARAVGLAMNAQTSKTAPAAAAPSPASVRGPQGMDQGMPVPPPVVVPARRRISIQPDPNITSLSRHYSNRVQPPVNRSPFPPERRRAPSNHSRDSVSTDGAGEGLLQNYNISQSPVPGSSPSMHQSVASQQQSQQQPLYLSSPDPGPAASPTSRQRKMRSPPMPPGTQQHPLSFMSTSSGGSNSNYPSPLASPGLPPPSQYSQHYSGHGASAYPSPLSPNFQQHQSSPSFSSAHGSGAGVGLPSGYMSPRSGAGSEGTSSIYSHDEQDEISSVHSGGRDPIRSTFQQQQQQHAAAAAKRRLQMQYDLDQQQLLQRQQQLMEQQQQLRDEEIMMQQRYAQRQQQQQQQQQMAPQQYLSEPAVFRPAYNDYAASQMSGDSSSQRTGGGSGGGPAPSVAETITSQKSSGSSKATSIKSSKSDKDSKDGGKKSILGKMKPPKPKASAADLMKSAGF
ncbi:hypothetical protein EMPS_10265 [Entomortierella parvispora]|uniref:BTB domain-containing protein n=1 Tax=Entomortierella parvispora TaxID=205924 RepID=A0A9P3M0U6_9FUNG|nr:hypothetical protein EMPS_10265 [Entomortierella parvispora]